MPIPAVLAAAGINAVTNIGGSLLNAGSQARENRRQRAFIRERYDVERADALSDWATQNEYNSPRMQMQRLQEANLNPHLIYGGGSGVTSAGSVRSTDSKSYTPTAPRYGDSLKAVGQGIDSYFNMKQQKAQTDNLTAINTNIMMDALLKKADLFGKNLTNEQRDELNKYSHEVFGHNSMLQGFLDKHDQSVAKVNLSYAQEKAVKEANARAEQLQPGNVQKLAEEIKKAVSETFRNQEQARLIQKQIDNLVKDGTLKKMHIEMRKHGLEPSDPAWQRILLRTIFAGMELTE